MKVGLVWDWDNPPSYLLGWQDGQAAMLNILQTKCDLTVYTQAWDIQKPTTFPHIYFDIETFPDYTSMCDQIKQDSPDVLLFWADMTRPAIPILAPLFPSACLFAGGFTHSESAKLFRHIFVESESYLSAFEQQGIPVSQAHGTNTSLFTPRDQPKMFDVFFPATFAKWKRHDLFARATEGLKGFCCGWKQDHEPECYEAPMRAGHLVTSHVPSHLLPDLYAASKVVCITSDDSGGSQRTVLEALAMNVPCIVMADSDKCSEYLYDVGYPDLVVPPDPKMIRAKIEEYLDKPVDTRPYIVDNYSESVYADKVYEVLCQLNS